MIRGTVGKMGEGMMVKSGRSGTKLFLKCLVHPILLFFYALTSFNFYFIFQIFS